jgi:hypothetical protein
VSSAHGLLANRGSAVEEQIFYRLAMADYSFVVASVRPPDASDRKTT